MTMGSNTPSYVDPIRYGDKQWDNTFYVSTTAYHQLYSHPPEYIQHSNCLGTSSYSDAAVISEYSFSSPYFLALNVVVPATDAYTDRQSAGGTSPLGSYSSQRLKPLELHEEDPAAIKASIEERQWRNKNPIPAPPSISNETVAIESTPAQKQQPLDTKRKRAEVFKKKWPQIKKKMEMLYEDAFSILRQYSREQHSSSGQNPSVEKKYFESSDLLGAWMPEMDCGVSTYWLGPPWWLGDIEYTTEIEGLTEEARKRILQHLICGEHSLKVSLNTLEILRRKMRAVDIHQEGRQKLEMAMAFHNWVLKTKNQRHI